MRVATITALVRLAYVGNERLGVLELALQRGDQCVLRVDRACRGACPEFQADCIRRHGSFLKVPGSNRTPIGVRLNRAPGRIGEQPYSASHEQTLRTSP